MKAAMSPALKSAIVEAATAVSEFHPLASGLKKFAFAIGEAEGVPAPFIKAGIESLAGAIALEAAFAAGLELAA